MNRVAPSQSRAPRRQTARASTGVKMAGGGAAIRRVASPKPSPVARVLRHIFSVWLLAKLAAAATLLVGLGAASQMAVSSQFHVAEIVITGNDLVAAEDIAATINAGGVNTFAVRGKRTERILRADPAIESASVSARLPDRVEVTVREREPAVVWEAGARTLLVDLGGLVLRDGTRGALPVVHAPDGPAPDPGGRVDSDAVRMAQSLAPRLDAEELGGGQLEYRPATGASIILPDSTRVALGSLDDLEDKLAAYRAIRSFLDQGRAHAQFIDVRFLERPYFR